MSDAETGREEGKRTYYRCTVENSDGVKCEVSVHSMVDGV
jgi:hypothetical protein